MAARYRPVRPPGTRPARPLPRTTCGVARHTEVRPMKSRLFRRTAGVLTCAVPALAAAQQDPAGAAAVPQLAAITVPASRVPVEARDQPVQVSVDRKSVVQGKGVSVRVCLGGARIIKKKHNKKDI